VKTLLATTSSFGAYSPETLELMKRKGFRFVNNPFKRKITEEELKNLLNKYQPIAILAGTEPITRSVLEVAAKHLKVISRVGVGWDNVDRNAAAELGILVYRTENVLNDAVAELTIGLVLSAIRNIPVQDRQIRQNKWQKKMGRLLKEKTLGIIGFGAIGHRVGELARGFGVKILYFDPIPKDVDWAEQVTLSELILRSDVISIHASGSECILGERELDSCKRGVVILNTARGGLVDEKCLYTQLVSGKIACACLDVFEQEPYSGKLTALDNVILTPHIGSYAREARVKMEEMAVDNLLKGLRR